MVVKVNNFMFYKSKLKVTISIEFQGFHEYIMGIMSIKAFSDQV